LCRGTWARVGLVRSRGVRCAFGEALVCLVWSGWRNDGPGRGLRSLLLLLWRHILVSRLVPPLERRW
jgi:hypothetical protein